MILHTFFIPYGLVISFHPFPHLSLQPSYELDKLALLTLFINAETEAWRWDSPLAQVSQLAKPDWKGHCLQARILPTIFRCLYSMRNLGNLIAMGMKNQRQRLLNETSAWSVYKPCPPPNFKLELNVQSKTG